MVIKQKSQFGDVLHMIPNVQFWVVFWLGLSPTYLSFVCFLRTLEPLTNILVFSLFNCGKIHFKRTSDDPVSSGETAT